MQCSLKTKNICINTCTKHALTFKPSISFHRSFSSGQVLNLSVFLCVPVRNTVNMLDHNLFREDRDDINNPNLVRESQRLRYADVDVVDQIIHLDKQRRQCICFFVSLFVLHVLFIFWTKKYIVLSFN